MKYSRTALGLLNAQYRSVLKKCFLINMGLFALGAIATATPANADETNKYDMVDGASVVLTENESITNTIPDGSGRLTAILANGSGSINTGDYTLTVNSTGATSRNIISDIASGGTMNFKGNLDATVTSTGSVDNNGLRATNNSVSVFDGHIKVDATAENGNSLAVATWSSATLQFKGDLTDISTKSTGNSEYNYAVQNFASNDGKVHFNAAQTNLKAEGGQWAEGVSVYQGSVDFDSNTNVTAKNGTVGTRAININCDAGNPYDSVVSLKGNSAILNAISEAGYSDAIGVLTSGTPGTFSSAVKNLTVNAESASSYAQGITSQYGGTVSLTEGTNTVVNATGATGAYGVASQDGWGVPGHFTSHGNLTSNATGVTSGYGAFVYKDSSFTADQLNATGTATGENGLGIGAGIFDSTGVVIGSEGKTSSLKGAADNGYGYGLDVTASSGNTASATLKGTMTVDGSSAGVNIEGTDATLTNEATLTVKNGIGNDGNFINNADIDADVVYNYEDGTFNNNGTLTVIDEDGDVSALQNHGKFVNKGTIAEASIDNIDTGTFINDESGLIDVTGEAYNAGKFINNGTFKLTEGGLENTSSEFTNGGILTVTGNNIGNHASKMTNSGTINVTGNILNGDDGDTGSTFTSTGTLNMTGHIINEVNSTLTLSGTSTLSDYNETGEGEQGGALYNEGTVTLSGTNTFSGNAIQGVANDIYNIGTLNIGGTTILEGGIDGDGDTKATNLVNVTDGVVKTSTIKNQTVNVNGGELALDKADLSGSTVAVNSDATINTIDDVANNYSEFVTLKDGAKIALDADLNDSASEGYKGFDKYSAESGATITISKLNLLSELSGSVSDRAFQIATAGNISIDSAVANSIKAYTSTAVYTLKGNDADDGTISLSGGAAGTGGLDKAVDNTTTDADEQVIYEVTADETFHDSADTTIDRAEFVINGNNKTVTSDGAASIKIANTSNVEISDLKLASFTGAAIDNQGGNVVMDNVTFEDSNAMALKNSGSAKLTNSTVKAKILNTGTFDSDPNDYYSEFENAAGATANFDADRFHTGSGLANNGTANFTNGVQFVDSGLAITGTGTVNLVNGTTVFDNTTSSNTINLASGADWSGVLASTGVVNTQNANIDTVTGSVTGGTLSIDANVAGKTIDTFGDASGAKIKSINLTNSQYGTDNTVSLSLSGASLDADYAITGGTNYFTEVTETGGNIVFGNKLVNASGMHDQIGSWAAGKNISASNTYDATTKSYATDGQTVAGALTALDTAIGDVNYADATVDPDSVLKTGAGAPTTVQGALDALDSGKQNKLTAGDGIDISSNTISAKAGDGTITVDPSGIKVGTIQTANIASGAVNKDKLSKAVRNNMLDNVTTSKGLTVTSGSSSNKAAIALNLAENGGLKETDSGLAVDEAATYDISGKRGQELAANIATYVAANGTKFADVQNTANIITDLFNDKAAYIQETTGMDPEHSVAYNYNQSSEELLHGATSMLNADEKLAEAIATKQDKLIAGQGIAIAADGKTISVKLADTTTSKSGLQLSDDGLSIKTGDTMNITSEGYLNIKYDTNTFTTDDTAGLKIADKGIKTGMIDNGAVTFEKLASSVYSTTVGSGSDTILATTSAVKAYSDSAIADAITFNSDNTVTLKVGSSSANIYDTTGTANYVKANAQSANYTAATSGAVDLTSNSTIAQALQTLDAKKASLAQDNTFTGANTFKSDSGITIQNKTTPAISSNLVATQLNIGTDTHDVLQLTVSDSTNKGSALYVKDANVVTNRGFMALDENGKDRFSADKDGIELKKASGETTFSVKSDTGNVTVAGTMDIEGDTTIGDNFSVKATDGSFSAAGGKFTVDGNGKITADSVTAANGFTVDANNSLTSAGLKASAANIAGDATIGGNATVDGVVSAQRYLNSNGTFSVSTGGTVTGSNLVSKNDLTVAGTSNLHNTNVDGNLGVTGDATVVGTAKVGALTFNGTDKVNAIDTGAAAITDGDATTTARKETMATTATVAKTIGKLANLENTHGVTSVADVASAINSLATNVETATGGKFTNDVWKGKVTVGTTTDYTYGGDTGYNNVMAAVSNIASNIGTATTAANGNITKSKSVNANLDALDEAIGDRRNLGSANEAINQGTKTSVAAGMRAVGDAIGDMNFAGSHYVAGNNDLSGAVRSLDSNLYRVESDLRDLRRDFRRGMASMSAMSALVPNPRAHGNTSLAIGTGAYDGHTAAAIGGFHYLTDNIMLNAGVAWGNSSDAAYRMGVTFSW